MTTENKVSAEQAEKEFDDFVDAMDLDLDESQMNEEDLSSYLSQKRRLIKAIMQGHLVFNEAGEPVYTPHRKSSEYQEPITFHERKGVDLMAMDNRKKGQDAAKMIAVIASMTKLHPKNISGLAGSDIKTCEAIFALLMG